MPSQSPPISAGPADVPLSLYHLLDPEVLANPYPLYQRLRTEDPVHWDAYLHAWVVTRYQDVITVLTHYSADRTPSPQFFEALGTPERCSARSAPPWQRGARSRLGRLASRAYSSGAGPASCVRVAAFSCSWASSVVIG